MRTLRFFLLGWAALTLGQDVPVFVEKPYLQLGDSPGLAPNESLMLLWHASAAPAAWTVEIQTSNDSSWRVVDRPRAQTVNASGIEPHTVYRARLTDLVPGESFRYRVLREGSPVFTGSGMARKSASQAFRFALFGDCAQGTPSQRAIAYQVAQTHPDFVFITGDIVYGAGRISEYRTKFFPVYSAEEISPRTGASLLSSIPFIAAPGNHDTALANYPRFPDALAYFLYWDQPLNGPVGKADEPHTAHVILGHPDSLPAFLAAAGPRYPVMANFSFDYGNTHWTVLDSNPYMDWNDTGLRQWLKRDLASAQSATWRFVGFHHPGFNSARTHFTDQWMRRLAPVFEEGKVDIVFSGHVHNYQRSFPFTFAPDPERRIDREHPPGKVDGNWKLDKNFGRGDTAKPKGVIYIVSGGGGAGLYDPSQTYDPTTWQPFTDKFIADTHSFSSVEIDGKMLRLRQLSESGKEVDAFRISK